MEYRQKDALTREIMISFIRSIKADLRLFKLRRRHRKAKLYDAVILDDATTLEQNVVLFSGVNLTQSQVGRSTYIQSFTYCHNAIIGPFCSIAPNVVIGLANHPMGFISTSPVFYDKSQSLPYFLTNGISHRVEFPKTEIGADVWIGHGAKIMAGVKIGIGAVIAAGAVVTNDVGPYEIVGGISAKLIRKRFDDVLINALLSSRWWERGDNEIRRFNNLYSNPQALIDAMGGK